MSAAAPLPAAAPAAKASLGDQVRNAVIWRSGTQIFSQLVAWASTFLVIRILSPSDYGYFAMTTVVMTLLGLINGYGFSNGLIRRGEVTHHALRQLFGMLIVLNFVLAGVQLAVAPWVGRYYHQPLVAQMLRMQALIYFSNPLLALGYAVLAREMDFRKQAKINMVAALLSAATALGGALAGLGVWTLVLAPLTMFTTRALGMAIAARALVWPSFDFRGTRDMWSYGGMLMTGQVFWFIQTQSDIAIAGRWLVPHDLGLYTTALFLSQIFVTKAVPPLNEVAFSAYARIKDDTDAVASGFLMSVRVIMTVAMPFCLGLAAVAVPAVACMLGPKYLGGGPIVRLLTLAMPFMTLQVLFNPAANARGRADLTTRSAVFGAVLMPACYIVGIRYGSTGLAGAWLVAQPILVVVTAIWLLPVIGVTIRQLATALLPPVLAGVAMALSVTALDQALPQLALVPRLALLVGAGMVVYLGWFALFARDRLLEIRALVLKR